MKKEFVTVYRIETKSGSGMYHSRFRLKNKVGLPNNVGNEIDRARHPTPYNDAGLSEWYRANFKETIFGSYGNAIAYSYGFSSYEQMRTWLYDDSVLVELSKRFYVVEFKVEKKYVQIGHTQCAFIKTGARRKRFGILEYFKINQK
jgi:hypothetical protein